jgi:hypothetical protein
MIKKGAQFRGTRSPLRLNFVQWRVMLLDPQYHHSDPYNFEVAPNVFKFYVPDDESVSVLSVLNIKFKPAMCKSQYSYSFHSTNFYSDSSIS